MISRKAFGIATKFPVVGDEVMPPAHLVGRLFFPRVVADAARMEGVFRTSALDWTMVRPPQLTNAPFSGKYRARHDHLPVFGFNISRADVAEFMVKCAEDANSIRKILGVAH
jgi:putative NADH-flavin reductase